MIKKVTKKYINRRFPDELFFLSTNSYDDGVGIQASRFNHSCSPNAEFEWNETIAASVIRVVSKINSGDEITVNYRPEADVSSKLKKY